MRKLLLFILIFSAREMYAQTTISGAVTDQKGGAIPGANIFLKDTYDGATSAADGSFSFMTTEKGDQVLSVSILGFEKWEQKILLDSAVKKIKVKLKESVSELKTVTIAAGAFEASDEKKVVMLRPLDIVTTAGANGDIYGALQTLPGTGVVGEKEGLYVRGGDASETKTYIDGLLVDNPYFSSVPDVPQRGRFSPFLFKGTSFSSGGYSAQYGQAMSSALILESQDLPDRTSTNIGLMSVGATVGHTKRWKKTSIGVYGGYTDLYPYFKVVSQNRDWIHPPKSVNGSIIFRHKTSETGMIKAFFSYTWSDLAVNYPDTSDPLLVNQLKFSLQNTNIYSTLSYKEIILKSWTVYAAASFSRNKDNISIDEFPVDHKNNLLESRLTLSHTIGELSVIRFGGEFQKPMDETVVAGLNQKLDETYAAGYAEGDIYITPKLVARAGVRAENSKVLERMNVAPRLSLAYKTGKYSQFSFGYGDFYQVPQKNFLINYPDVNLLYEKATHYILNFQSISDLRTFRIEAYYKDYNHLSRYVNSTADNSGFGHSRGIEFFFRDKKTISRSDYWISYSFLDTKRLYQDYRYEAMPTFAAKNTASLVFKYFIPKISLAPALTYVYSSGRPYYNPNNENFLADRTKDYHNLSLNFSYLTSIGKNFTVVVFSIGNILGVKNVFTYNYSSDGTHRIAVGPTSDRVFFAGVFINIGSQSDDSDKYN
jgi:vitamin B12 transporter